MKKEELLARGILEHIGGKENIHSFTHCMTRVRINLKEDGKANIAQLKELDGVMGVIEDDTLQIVVGPGTVNKVSEQISRITGIKMGEVMDVNEDDPVKLKKNELKGKNNTPVKNLLRKIGSIFIPLIPGLVASGIINGAVGFLKNAGVDENLTWMQILAILGGSLFAYLAIVVGWNTAKEFGGTPVLGAIAGIITMHPGLADVVLFGQNLVPGRGGLFGVMFAAGLMVFFEKQYRKFVPNAVDIIITPLLTLLTVGLLTIAAVQPITGYISDGITNAIHVILDIGGIVAGGLLAGFFLPLVMLGLHHGLTPIHMELINTVGSTALLPILAMAGAGQVGASIAIYVKTKNKRMKNVIKGGLPTGFLGIGEPLLYGVTLPLGRPFITACLGAAVGGAFQAVMHTAARGIGVSGIPLIPLIVDNKYLVYFLGLLITYTAGFLFTYFFGYKKEMDENF
ncbi:PTS transporter subunit EIIC [Caldibacillus thermolactis]|jgi:sucrose PTS system EIIBCA or EIIBC component|uniref:PTS transporter subunit EIIC n=1 Tax=Pallidibacillus thermolactis TaxID=251051 RepID=A0ABT2WB64_9BACI|nr:PTS transporter subunit EIIC [Pallidibacillus thermolactis]MCU9592913.1 PTS transporter subunit EIIC [Pallidibacillus thermolactis]MCU9602783.1 PTS transporter subunit EIIC [Pallidibacillus thermolactis subsp. kokeshiiformis]MED1673639.1 PTS transporter subunit EIIC [Pallidibacillus thermolactis subsp. kokeshiiformis]